ncbi:unnamed protein product [Mytilus edulis]|uniref:Uncharacterized protein n=1 Tax=Mytilus edulis TaxID=6550 RepID=A0A8S3UDB2_MYTED|nr:unnamed protein product [Mytilus edulis]
MFAVTENKPKHSISMSSLGNESEGLSYICLLIDNITVKRLISEVVEDFSSNLNNNHKEVTEFVKGFEKLSKHESDLIQKSVADQSRAIKHTQEAVEKMGVQLVTNNAEIIKMRESQAEECAVLWHLKTPKEWNENAVADTLRDFEKLEDKQDFKIKFVREGSLIILTTVPYGILHDKIKYEDAIKKFLTRMMNVCSINTEAACDVEATLHILENDEVSIQHSYVLCEDKSTQISIPQEDKCFQVNSYDWCDLTYEKSQKDVKPKLQSYHPFGWVLHSECFIVSIGNFWDNRGLEDLPSDLELYATCTVDQMPNNNSTEQFELSI